MRSRSASHVYDRRLYIMIVILFFVILVSNVILTREYVLASNKNSGMYVRNDNYFSMSFANRFRMLLVDSCYD